MSILQIGTRVHIVGIGGAGMSGLARLLLEMGAKVSGSDAVSSPILDELRALGAKIVVGHSPRNVNDADVVLWSPAIGADNAELVAAKANGSTLLSRAEALAELGELRRIIGFTGTHGKTTATSMMVQVMAASGVDDGRLLGANVLGVGANGHWGKGDLILEVDESYGTFALLTPYALGLLNVDVDHLDHYGSLVVLEAAFTRLLNRVRGPLVVWVEDPGVRRVVAGATRDFVRVGTGDTADWVVENVSLQRRGATFSMRGPSDEFDVTLSVTGAHNVANAAVVAVLALSLGQSSATVRDGLARFQGAPRRFEFVGTWKGVEVFEDYAHLPGEIAATLAATRASGYERITAVFQPHRITRTLSLGESFATAFDEAANVIVTDIYSAGEPNPDAVTGELVATAIRERRTSSVTYCASLTDVPAVLDTLRENSDVIVLLGAGDVAHVVGAMLEGIVR
jgi:UDP-N-acetylmuramate--alanine ligase